MEVDIGTEEDDMHAKEYALALQRVVLENADEIFTACKEYDRENHGILSTEVFFGMFLISSFSRSGRKDLLSISFFSKTKFLCDLSKI